MKKNYLRQTIFSAIGDASMKQLKKGANREKYLKDPRYRRTRENNQEFAGSTLASKILRLCLNALLGILGDNTVTYRLVKVFRAMINHGSGVRGQRTIDVVANKGLLIDFEFDSSQNLNSVFPVACKMTATADRKEVSLEIPAFDPYNSLRSPEYATHFKVFLLSGLMPSLHYDANDKGYVSNDPDNEGKYAKAETDYLPVTSALTKVTTIKSTFAAEVSLQADTAVVGCLGIAFYQEVNGEKYILNVESCMKVHSIF